MIAPPKIENAPGLKWKPIKAGWQARWRARGDLVSDGYKFKSVRIWESTTTHPEPDEITKSFIADRCTTMQDDMLLWSKTNSAVVAEYDETWGGLIRCYKTDPDSPYHKKEYATRQHYNTLCRRVDLECGADRIEDTDARKLLRIHENVIRPDEPHLPPKIPMGHAVIGMMRTITTFGATILKCKHCRLVRSDLRDMRIPNGKPREDYVTPEQATAIRRMAHTMVEPYRHSIALGQAFQFDVASGVRQKDVIGEWIPLDEPGPPSDIISGGMRWVKGLRGEEIDDNLVWRHLTSKRKKPLIVELRLSPMVMEEFRMMAGLRADEKLERHHIPLTGPLIINEQTGEPWTSHNYRAAWRVIARACDIPDNVKNMDSRAGAMTEANEAEADEDDIMRGATHSTPGMTRRYIRGSANAKAAARVMQKRAGHRNKGGTE